MKIVYLVRHGQTDSNVKKVSNTPVDPLTPLGETQAGMVAERFRELTVDGIMASSYERAQQTAQAIAKVKNLPIETTELLIEVQHPTILDGQSQHNPQFADIYKRRAELWGTKDEYVGGEENFYDVDARVTKTLALLAEHPAQHLVAVTHGGYMKAMVEHILLGDMLRPELTQKMYMRFAMVNTGVTVLAYINDEWNLVRWNDTVHLDPEHETY